MKKLHHKPGILLKCCLWICFPFLFLSCDDYYFSVPQPVDKPNMDEFPKMLRGKWNGDTNFVFEFEFSETLEIKGPNELIYKGKEQIKNGRISKGYYSSQNTNQQREEFIIGKDYLYFIWAAPEKIFNGFWPDSADLTDSEIIKSFRELRFDSLKMKPDTVDNYIINKNLIYEIGSYGALSRGYSYRIEEDTITLNRIDTIIVKIGFNGILRRLKKNLYVLNISNYVMREDNPWWRVIILEYRDNSIYYSEINHKTGKLPCMFYAAPSKYDQFYFDCEWSTPELIRLIDEGYFSISNRLIKE